MLVACINLVTTLSALHFATAIGVTGVCPAYVQINTTVPGHVLDFSAATANRLDLININGMTVNNFTSTGATYSALNIRNSTQILINQPHIISPGTAGITIQGSDTVEVAEPWVEESSGDGVDIAGSTNINIHDGACENNVRTSTHPDCVQLWSITGYPVQHVIVQNMTAVGQTQGFDLWDGTDFGAKDIQFLNDTASLSAYSNCIVVLNAHQVVVTGNTCHTLQGANGPNTIFVTASPDAIVENNVLGSPLAAKVVN